MKYLKYFKESFEEEKNLKDDIIIKELMSGLSETEDIDEFDYAEAIFCYTQDYNEDIPYIHYLKSLLVDVSFQPGYSFGTSDLSGWGQLIYETLVETDIYKKIIESKNIFRILGYLKENDISFFNYISRYIDEDKLDSLGDMGTMGF